MSETTSDRHGYDGWGDGQTFCLCGSTFPSVDAFSTHIDPMTSVPPTQPPAAPETDARRCSSPGWCGGREGHYRDCPVSQAANGLTDAEHEKLADAFWQAHRSEFMDTDLDLPILQAVERIVAERVRVVEGEGDAVVEVGAYAQQKEATARAVNDATRMAQVAARRTRELAAMTARAESAEAAHRALQAAVEALADEYAEYGAQREAAGRPAWPNNVARDLRALPSGGAR